MAQAEKTQLSADEFLALPESKVPHELIDGEQVMSPAPGLKHQDVVFALAKLIENLSDGGRVRIAPVDLLLDSQNIVQPDVLWTAPDSKSTEVDGKYMQGAPELIVEVLSPGTAAHDRVTKFRLYEKSGVREYWIVDPAEHVLEAWQLQDDRYTHIGSYLAEESFQSPILGGKDVKLATIFAQ